MNILAQQGVSGGTVAFVIGGILLALFALVIIVVVGQFISLYVQAMLSNAHVGLWEIIGMRLRKVDVRQVVYGRIRAVKAGMDIPTNAIETHYLAGGDIRRVISAMVAAKGAKIELPWSVATAIDLAGRDIFDAVQTSVNPKVIDCPSPGGPRTTIDAVAQDGIQLKAKARVTVRTAIGRLVGGATEETIVARVGEGIVTTIGSAHTYKEVLENPDKISKTVMAKGLDAGSAFEILSIDIADIDVGENTGAKLQAEQAQADKSRFQAEAEKRRALALALEAENKAKIEENKAKVVLAQAEVPLAIAEAFRSGRLGVMDYYKLQNMQADTNMRESIAGESTSSQQTRA